jgi:hypothetical protein
LTFFNRERPDTDDRQLKRLRRNVDPDDDFHVDLVAAVEDERARTRERHERPGDGAGGRRRPHRHDALEAERCERERRPARHQAQEAARAGS